MSKYFSLSVRDKEICDLKKFLVKEEDLANVLLNMDKDKYEVVGSIENLYEIEEDIKTLLKQEKGLEHGGKQ